MSSHYGAIAFTPHVKDLQERYGSRRFYGRHALRSGQADGPDPLTADVRDYLAERDSFYLATVSETGWPYVQFRGGPPGFLRFVDEHTIGWADFRGNLQHVSTGNLATDGRVALLIMDYPNRRRLKMFGHARVVFAEDDPALVGSLTHADYQAVVERAVVVTVDAFDWNCPQHITPRYTAEEIQPLLTGLRSRVDALEEENARLRSALPTGG
jgi:predicted pyridoxine 5'-phosphate oxidase superfamily flavin-nucleotide-binding protein